ncbi:DNA-3-methyladenine glycosylase 2 family protein [Flavobacterium sp. F-328]|uniref:DNA-3-methyladenine glycosylase II n=1 Tax=Flavobacterium erciyesense TaxID=2825842 RepID=A0ABS5D1S1_9FLAO|nr:DNA-3-methyladenine glycosylase 2 family protein [Flavobacterium erciyesense]MBQ0907949.1 DNA-3-methyladenine glycosylase 2 family protein [Flavobacterium erciyesense]
MILETEKILSNNDPILAKVILQIPKPEIESTNDVFHDLVSCIFEQQIHYRSTKRIFAKALEKSSIEHLTLDNFYLVEEHYLKNSNLATGKYETLLAFIDYWSNNTKDFNTLSDNEVVKELSSIKGIGKWTIDMILLYTLQRQNVFPYDDYHLKQIMVSLYGLNEKVKLKAQMLEIAENWGEHKSLAVLYLLAFKKFGTRL